MNDAGKVAFTPKGAYNNTVTYEYLDTVVYDGNSYAALRQQQVTHRQMTANIGNCL